jgi:hypothetical protein
MIAPFKLRELSAQERGRYGFARVRDAAFDAVMQLWRERQAEGMKQSDLSIRLDRDAGWVSRTLRGPGNWTMKTLGQFVEALDGDIEIRIQRKAASSNRRDNFDAYAEFDGASSVDSARLEFSASIRGPDTITSTNSSKPMLSIENVS